jgi:hypothetical protein
MGFPQMKASTQPMKNQYLFLPGAGSTCKTIFFQKSMKDTLTLEDEVV